MLVCFTEGQLMIEIWYEEIQLIISHIGKHRKIK